MSSSITLFKTSEGIRGLTPGSHMIALVGLACEPYSGAEAVEEAPRARSSP
ncbi:MAG: hypothetical protein HY791_20795 [Deltaproteobacteria bacterium]|nr:hypothetical protein [Deltaproteobacteria bacterium]